MHHRTNLTCRACSKWQGHPGRGLLPLARTQHVWQCALAALRMHWFANRQPASDQAHRSSPAVQHPVLKAQLQSLCHTTAARAASWNWPPGGAPTPALSLMPRSASAGACRGGHAQTGRAPHGAAAACCNLQASDAREGERGKPSTAADRWRRGGRRHRQDRRLAKVSQPGSQPRPG